MSELDQLLGRLNTLLQWMLKNMEGSGRFQRLLFTQMVEPKQRLWIDYNVHEGRKSIFFATVRANARWSNQDTFLKALKELDLKKKTKGFVSSACWCIVKSSNFLFKSVAKEVKSVWGVACAIVF